MAMKLVFAGGECPPVVLEQRAYSLGSELAADLVLPGDDVAPMHCELRVGSHGVQLRIPPGRLVEVNERPVDGVIALRPGDALAVGGVRMRLVAVEAPSAPGRRGDDLDATMVRPVVPKLVLRGLSGELFGRTFPLNGGITIGRASEADVRVELDGISRMHARLTAAGEELIVEDLGSANGTWLNGRRVTRAQAGHGDELRFDTQRFQVLSPGRPLQASPRLERGGLRNPWVLAAVALAVALLGWWLV